MNKGEFITAGRTAEIFAWGENHVLKLYRAGFPADEAENEAGLARAVYDGGVKTPAVIEVVEVDGRQGIIFERIHGPTMLDAIQANPIKAASYARMLAELQAEMHGHQTNALRSQRERLQRQIARIFERDIPLPPPAKEVILTALNRLPEDHVFCHGDFHPGNIILTAEGPLIIDWIDVTQGHPLADVARSSILLHAGKLPGNPFRRLLIIMIRRRFYKTYLKRYGEIRPFPPHQLTAWELPIAAARLSEGLPVTENQRLLAIVQNHLSPQQKINRK
jgi:uncharacterized protein (TIGR02172 family)